jgi:hypothetical protein
MRCLPDVTLGEIGYKITNRLGVPHIIITQNRISIQTGSFFKYKSLGIPIYAVISISDLQLNESSNSEMFHSDTLFLFSSPKYVVLTYSI